MAGECERIQGETIKAADSPSLRFFTIRQPIGPVALMCPWNFPGQTHYHDWILQPSQMLMMSRFHSPVVIALRKLATALAAGCTVVLKPSPESPITTVALAILCKRAGFADGVVNVVTASHETTPVVGRKLCEDPRIKKLSFTGSTAVCSHAHVYLVRLV
jgi:succinate-semialdehyde dehydrogenase/glutarate-semialdehyde dehydrogenase